jgi:hypothetical protein
LCEYRCWPLLDEMSNWQVDQPGPLKYITSISEVMHVSPGDDIYASQPVTYVRLAALPGPNNPQPVIDALMHGQTFWTTGEVLLPAFAIVGEGRQRKIVADVEWTLPLDFIEVVWGDGRRSGRQVIPTTDLPPMGRKHFEIPLDARGKKWVRFAAWDIAADGAVTQPIRLKEAH